MTMFFLWMFALVAYAALTLQSWLDRKHGQL
jgi:hypothetical protein